MLDVVVRNWELVRDIDLGMICSCNPLKNLWGGLMDYLEQADEGPMRDSRSNPREKW